MKLERKNSNMILANTDTKSIKIFVNENIDLEKTALEELENFSNIEGVIDIAITPDFHKGSGTPIGTTALIDRVYPNIIGNDQGCGMRFDVTDLTIDDIEITEKLMDKVRHLFFEGGGNHFCEIQIVDEIVDKQLAFRYGIKKGSICIMCHSGSLDIGHLVSFFFKEKAKELWTGEYPVGGYFPLNDKLSQEYLMASYNAANFAMVNRMVMSGMMAEALNTSLKSVYDSPHNLVWDNGNNFLHRKGSCPAEENEPVIIPGSMGTRSAICVGKNFSDTYSSSPHGAGRVLNRNAARKSDDIENINIVTKIDYKKARDDVKSEIKKTLGEESPRVYKDITEVVNTVNDSGIASVVAWMKPLMTVKG